MSNPIVKLAEPLIKDSEGFYRRDRNSGLIKSYADPASPLGRAIQRKGKWQAYLDDLWEPTPDMMKMSGAPWTIGWGSTGPDIGPNTKWTVEQCQARFVKHTSEFLGALMRIVGGLNLRDFQLAALLSLFYNLGEANFSKSTLLRKLRAGDLVGAAAQFLVWNKGGKPLKVLPGLVERRAKEKALFEGTPA